MVDRLAAVVDELLGLDVTRLGRDSVFAVLTGVETQLRRSITG